MGKKPVVLLISYVFPPAKGIAGRRWAKFSKYLNRQGVETVVLTADSSTTGNTSWGADLQLEKTFHFPTKYPMVFSAAPNALVAKIRYRVMSFMLKAKYPGNIYDRTLQDGSKLREKVRTVIKAKKVSTVIVTAPPFHYLHHLLPLKKEFQNVKWIADFRDPWTNNQTSFGYDLLPPKRAAAERKMESEVFRQYDQLFAVHRKLFTDGQLNEIGDKLVEVPNGFDPDDFQEIGKFNKKSKDKKRFIFGGTFYQKASHLLMGLEKGLEELQEKEPELYGEMEFHFYGNQPKALVELHEKFPEFIKIFAPILLKRLLKRVHEADVGLLFLTDDLDYSFSTKFCEYVGAQKPILVFSSKKGATAQFVEDHNLGWSTQPTTVFQNLKRIGQEIDKGEISVNSKVIDRFNIKTITQSILPHL